LNPRTRICSQPEPLPRGAGLIKAGRELRLSLPERLRYNTAMKPRHAAALALFAASIGACSRKPPVAWYLITPPPTADSKGVPLVGPDYNAPLDQWQKGWFDEDGKRFDSFDSR